MSDAGAQFGLERPGGEAGGRAVLRLSGRLDALGAAAIWRPVLRAVPPEGALTIDLHEVPYCDMAGASLLVAIEAARPAGPRPTITGASPRIAALVEAARTASLRTPHRPAAAPRPWASLRAGWQAALNGVAFFGELTLAWIRLPGRRRMLRMGDLLRYADQAGVRALPLVLLLGYLMGLILAFQSAIPMRRFGADLFVANLVAISLLRELGPLLSAVILAGRTGSAFAAEIGTMKVNEEVDALTTMGLDTMTMQVLPRLLAAMLVMPALALALDIAGLLGMATVMNAFGFPLVTIAHQVQSAAKLSDLFGGLFKGMCFGGAVAVIGCRAGLATGVGPRAVGEAATAAVVGGIVATVLLDGLFALLFYRLGL